VDWRHDGMQSKSLMRMAIGNRAIGLFVIRGVYGKQFWVTGRECKGCRSE
jgi:hypothetical protein